MDGMRGKIFHGPAAIASLYRELHQYFDEEVAIGKIALTDDFIAVEVPTLLHCRKDFDLPGFVPIPAGQTCRMTCFNHYDLAANGKIRRIRVAIQSMDYLPSKN
jgi:hypothetical protein